jgi:lactate permease
MGIGASQVALAQSGNLSLPWLAAIQNVGCSALTMLSPIRVSIGCTLAGVPRAEADVYRRIWIYGALSFLVLLASAGFLLIA